jgi:hypothetical protein
VENLLLFQSSLAGDGLKLERRGAIPPAEAFSLLSQAARYAQERAFDYAPLQRAPIAVLAKEFARPSLAETAASLESAKGLDDRLAKALTLSPSEQLRADSPNKAADMEKGLAGLARSCLWNELLYAAFGRERARKPAADAKPSEVRFAANWDGWMFVKKAGATSGREEVLACLSSVYVACSRRAAALSASGGDAAVRSALQSVSKLLAGRRSVGRVAGALAELDRACRAEAQRLSTSAEGRRLIEHHLFDGALASAGHAPYPDPEDIGRVFPHLKVQKPRGRVPGQKAKAKP